MAAYHYNMKLSRNIRLLVPAIAAVLATVSLLRLSQPEAASARLLHTEASEFAPVLVFEEFGQRCMNFNTMKDTWCSRTHA